MQLIYAMQKEGLVCEWFSAPENTIVYAATELGRVALEAFEAKIPPPGTPGTFEDALDFVMTEYDDALRKLAESEAKTI